MFNPQFDAQRRLHHVLTTEGWPRALLTGVLDRIDAFESMASGTATAEGSTAFEWARQAGQPCKVAVALLAEAGPAQAALASAAHRCGWEIDVLEPGTGSSFDSPAAWMARLGAADVFVVAHPASGMSYALAAVAPAGLHIVNLLDGAHAAPVAALAEVSTLRRRLPDLHTRVLTLCGDLVRDARMRSTIHMLTTLGVPRVNVVHAGVRVPAGAAQLGVHAVGADEQAAAMTGVDAVLSFPVPPDLGQAVKTHGLPSEPERPAAEHEVSSLASVFCAVMAQIRGRA